MRLASANGNSVTVRLDGYQYPAITGSGDNDYDANWLMVACEVVNGGRSWSFRDPCLLTWDAHEIAGWLRSVSDGSRRPEPISPDGDDGGLLVFTEPNLAFNLHERTPNAATIRVYLSLEALPSGAEPEIFEYFVELTMTTDAVAAALSEWEAELRQYPVRA